MKKRNRNRRKQDKAGRFNWLGLFEARMERRRPNWAFELLEDRNFMSATPLDAAANIQWTTISSDTPGGQQLIRWLELDAAQRASGSSNSISYAPDSLPTDPNLLEQWHLINVGQSVNPFSTLQPIYGLPGMDLNVLPVWDRGITGNGVVVAVVDTGVQSSHPDLLANLGLQWAFDATTGAPNGNPSNTSPAAAHGTAVAGLIGADANSIGGVGVAYGSTIVPIKLLATGLFDVLPTDQAIANAILGNGAPIDIFNHSWSPNDPENPRASIAPSQVVLDALILSATQARNGLGAIHVFSAGNDAGPQFSDGFQDIGFLDSIGSNGYASSRYVISVGAVDHDGDIFNEDGTIAVYSEAGTSLLVVAPSASGPFDIASNVATGSGIFTTDLINGGINIPTPASGVSSDVDLFPNANYTSRFGGTSAAAPQVSGVIALMLEADRLANDGVSTLTYRDVQEILVRSARQVNSGDSAWIVNSVPFFQAPTVGEVPQWEIGMNAAGEPIAVRVPADAGYNPVIAPHSLSQPGSLFTNGAGYTVSQGWMTDLSVQYGWGHGMIDADLAVKMASQWNLKDQSLAPEKTVVRLMHAGHTINAAYLSPGYENINGDDSLIPGAVNIPGLVPPGNYPDYYDELFKVPEVIAGTPAAPPVPATPPMIDPETLPFAGENPPQDSRGTFYQVEGVQNMSVEWVELQLDMMPADANDLDFLRITLVSPNGTHSELTHYQYAGNYQLPGNQQYWRGDRSIPDPNGTFYENIDPPGTLHSSTAESDVFSWTFTSNRHWGERADGAWEVRFENYGGAAVQLGDMRMIFHGQDVGSPGVGAQRYLGFVDDSGGYLGHGSNATVYVKDAVGNRVSQFVTGADGNFYFDLAGSGYTLGIDVPAGYKMVGTAPNEVPLASGKHFQIEPLTPAQTAVQIKGQVFADLDSDGVQDATDAGVKNFVVFADLNHNGQFEVGEPNTLTGNDGTYTIPFNVTEPTLISIGIKPPAGWEVTNPVSGFVGTLASANTTVPIIANFGVKPPSNPTGQGNATIYGLVFNDSNGNGIKEAFETGIADLVVYLDNGNGKFDPGIDVFATTTSTGAYVFNDVVPGSVLVRVDVDPVAFQLTVPSSGQADVTVSAGQVLQGVFFGIRDLRTHDFGDLVGLGFRSSLAEDGPRHFVVQGFSLGSRVDAEVTANVDPAHNAMGDDLAGGKDAMLNIIDDEDGVVLVGGFLRPGVNNLKVTLQGEGGYLQGWIDFDKSGTFEPSEQVFTNLDLLSGERNLSVTAPADLPLGQNIAARFRWGTQNKTYFGSDIIGEVEDYLFTTKAAQLPGDYNDDQVVNTADYDLWKSTYGSTADLRADGNKNNVIDLGDYTTWRDHKTAAGAGAGGGALAGTVVESPVAPPPAQQLVAGPTPVDPPAESLPQLSGVVLPQLGQSSQADASANGAGQVAVNSGAGSSSTDSDVEYESGLSLANASFSTTVSIHSTSTVQASTGPAAAEVDSMLLLLATGLEANETSLDHLSGSGGLEWGKDEGGQDADFELAVNAAFGDETDWWLAL